MDNNYLREGEIPEERMIELVKNHLEISISQDVADFDNVDCHIYSESTADGYDVYMCTNNPSQPSICEDVYYYDNDLPALTLYQHVYTYGLSTEVQQADIGRIDTPRDRYETLGQWFLLFRVVASACPEPPSE